MHLHPTMKRPRSAWPAWSLALLLGATVVALAGCGGVAPAVPGPVPEPHRFQLQLTPSKVALAAGDVQHLTVKLTRSAGFSGPVTLSLNGAPGGLTASFTPDSADPDTVDAALQVTRAVVPLEYSVYIDGASGTEQENAPFTTTVLDPVTLDVQGRVVDLFRRAVPGATVTIAGASTTAASDGSFAMADVAWPYDVTVTLPGKNEVHEYLGLTRANPVLPVLDQVVTPTYGASVAGTLTGSSANGNQEITEVAFASPEANGGTVLWANGGPDFGPFGVAWEGTSTTHGSLVALKWSVGPSGLPQKYLGFAAGALSLSDQQVASGSDLELSAVGTSYLSGTLTVPAGFTVASKALWMTPGRYTGMLLGTVGDSDPQYTFATPVAGEPLGVQAKATLGNASTTLYRAGLQPNQVVDLALPDPPALGAPASGTVDYTTVFQWTPVADTVSVLTLTSQTGPAVFVYTASASAGLPQPPLLTLPASTRYLWTVVAWGMDSDMDAFTDPARGPGSFGLARDALVAIAEPVGFFTSATP